MLDLNSVDEYMNELMEKIETQNKFISNLEAKRNAIELSEQYRYETLIIEATNDLLDLCKRYQTLEEEYLEPKDRFNYLKD